jgi:hypothetical protein
MKFISGCMMACIGLLLWPWAPSRFSISAIVDTGR